jgi:DNA-binding response OmpR family regulator
LQQVCTESEEDLATRGTILVVDDTPDSADLLRAMLEEAGYRVLVAPTAEIGVQILRAFRIGLVITAALQPESDGADDPWAAVDRLVGAGGGAPLILAAPDEPERYADYAAHGCAACLTTPLNLDGLPALVGSLLLGNGQDQTIVHAPAPARER